QELSLQAAIAIKNANLFDETEQRAAELAIINSVQEGLASKLEIQAIYDLVGDKVTEIFHSDTTYIQSYNAKEQSVYAHYYVERGQHQQPGPLPFGRGLYSKVIQSRQPILYGTQEEWLKAGGTIINSPGQERELNESVLLVPILLGSEVTGVLSIQSYKQNAFGKSDERLLQTLANSMSVALENARLFDETQRLLQETEQRNAELAIINSVQQGLASKLELQALYDLVGDKIRDIFDAQSVLIATYDHVTRTRSFPYNWEKGERIYIPGGSPFNKLAEHLIATRETVVINESALERGTELGMSQVPGTAAMMSGVFVPLVTGDTVTGFISLQNVEREHAFSESDVRLLQTLASSMSVALESARLFDETQRLLKETEQRNAELAIINKVQEGLASKLEMEAIYNLVGDEVRSIFDAQAVLIVTYDRAANLFHYPYNIEKGERFYVEPTEPMGFSKHMLTTRQPILIKNNFVKHYEEITGRQVQQFTGEQPKSWLGVPLLVGSEVRGTISLQNVDREEAYSESDLRLLNTLAGTMSVALENARLFDETQRLLKETEQRAAELSIINSVQEGLASKLDMQAIYDLVGDKIHQVFNAPTVTLETIDHQIEMIHVRYGLDNGERFTAEPYRYGNITREMLRTRQPVLVRSAAEFDAYGVGTLHGTGTTGSGVFVPLIIGDQIKGKLTIQSERENAFGDSDVRLLQTLSSSMSVALENARLFDETQRLLKETEQRAAELSIINSVQEGLASKLEMQAIYDLVGDKIRDIFDTQSMLIAIFDLESGTDVIPYHMEDGERRYPEPSALTKFERHIIETRQPIMLNEDMEHLAPQYGMQVIPGTDAPKSGMWVPLISGNQARGMISIQNLKRERAYSDADLRLLQTLANSMSVALENARLFDETQRLLKETEQRNAELAIINSVQEGLASKLERQGIIDLIGDKICEVFGIQDMFIGLHDPAKGLIQFPYGKTEGQHDAMSAIPFGQGLSSHVIRTRQPLVINENMQKRGAELGVVMDRDSHHRIKSWVGVPIVVGNSAIGLISLQDLKHEGAFDASKVNLLMTLGNAMGVALESSRLFAETEQRATELAIINGVQEGLASKLEEQAAYELVGEKLRELFDRQGISLIEFDLDKNIRHYRYLLEKGQRIDPPDAAISPSLQYIIDTRKPMLINERIDESMAALGLVSMTVPGTEPVKALLRVPIFIGGQVKGAVGLSNFERENVFTDSDVRLLTTLAGSLSVALESARLFEETKRNAAELATVNTVSSALASELDVSALINLVGEQTRTIFRADIAFVALFDEDTRIINFPYEYGQHLEPLPLGQGLSSKIIESGQPLLINEDIDHRREQLGVPVLGKQARSFLGVPISVSGKAIGVVSVQSTAKENIFTEEDVRLLSTIAANVGVALQNARLFAEVKRQGQYLETLFANMPVAIVRVDENAKVITWSPAAEKLFGYTGQEAVGKDVDSLVANSDAVREEAVNYSRQSIGNQAVHSITRRTRKDGTLVDVDLSAIPLPLENGKMGIVAIYNDVGEIQRQRTYYEGIVQNSPVAIVTVDPEGNIVSWNPGAEQLFGYMRDEAIDHNVDDLVASSGDLRAEAQTYNKQASADELHVITKRTRKDGSLVDVELSGVPLALPNGKSGLVAIYHDITELQRARQEAIAANEAKSSFLATMSHEIRTPMNAVIGMSGLLLDTELNTEQHDYAETIRNSGDSLLNIINDILDFSKIEAGRMELESQPFDLRDCVESALDLVTARAVEKGIDTAYILDDDVPAAILGDVTRLRQILLNLFSNAVKFTERGEVVLTVHAKSARRKKYVELAFSVRDTGIGLSKEGMGRLFQSFSQADSSTTRKYGGTGLGLAISKRLAEMMDGTMWAESEGLGKGSTFTFTINVPVAEHSPVKHREFVGVQPELREKRVLIVDDNATNRRILVAQTSKWGMGSAETESPVQALQWLKDGQTFDLAILDMHMPEMDGVALATEIRGLNLSLPLVLFSSLGRREVGDKAELFSAYLTKPIKQSQLFDTLVSIFADTQRIRERKTDPTHVALDPEMA
ncbi:MAG TPA: GAF domain-containing protein, partial [Anaerolineales bacterium]|nr:GAF domain-containing protein [Anaerolineales bacterium]